MSRNNGDHYVGPRPYCGKRYRLTNYMKRSKELKRGHDGRWLNNTHLIACHRKNVPEASSHD